MKSIFFAVKHSLRHLPDGRAWIVNVGSISGMVG
jgi:hypothetical protein